MNFQHPILTASEIARLDTWSVELAEEARGPAHDAGNGDWRIGDSRSLISPSRRPVLRFHGDHGRQGIVES